MLLLDERKTSARKAGREGRSRRGRRTKTLPEESLSEGRHGRQLQQLPRLHRTIIPRERLGSRPLLPPGVLIMETQLHFLSSRRKLGNKRGVGPLTAIIVHPSLKFLLRFRRKKLLSCRESAPASAARGAQRGESLEQRQKGNQPPELIISVDLFGVAAA